MVWNHGILGLSIQLGMSSSQLTKSIIFQRGRAQPATRRCVLFGWPFRLIAVAEKWIIELVCWGIFQPVRWNAVGDALQQQGTTSGSQKVSKKLRKKGRKAGICTGTGSMAQVWQNFGNAHIICVELRPPAAESGCAIHPLLKNAPLLPFAGLMQPTLQLGTALFVQLPCEEWCFWRVLLGDTIIAVFQLLIQYICCLLWIPINNLSAAKAAPEGDPNLPTRPLRLASQSVAAHKRLTILKVFLLRPTWTQHRAQHWCISTSPSCLGSHWSGSTLQSLPPETILNPIEYPLEPPCLVCFLLTWGTMWGYFTFGGWDPGWLSPHHCPPAR